MKSLTIIAILILTSCASQKVAISVETWKPYCGGAKPTPEMAQGIRTPFANERVAINKMSDDLKSPSTFLKWIQLDSEGKWTGGLKPGTYQIYRADKLLSLEEIEKKYRQQDNEMYAFVGLETLTSWKATPDLSMEVKENSEVKIELKEKCFVGLNPCMEYIGPKPR
jgi:hypothetical protein